MARAPAKSPSRISRLSLWVYPAIVKGHLVKTQLGQCPIPDRRPANGVNCSNWQSSAVALMTHDDNQAKFSARERRSTGLLTTRARESGGRTNAMVFPWIVPLGPSICSLYVTQAYSKSGVSVRRVGVDQWSGEPQLRKLICLLCYACIAPLFRDIIMPNMGVNGPGK